VTPVEAVAQATSGKLLPVYVVTGEEQLLRDEVVAALRAATLSGGVAAFNEDKFTAGEANVEAVVSAARTVPMMAPRRFVLIRGAERWEGAETDSSPFDRLLDYAKTPVESTCMVIVASKLDGRRKFALAARKGGYVVACEPLDSRALPSWIVDRCARKGHAVDREVAELVAALVGPQLSPIDDAIERLSLYVGPGAPIDETAVGECVARIRAADTWALVDAVRSRDLGQALRTLADAYDPRDRGIMLLGALAWSIRQLARFQASLQAGASEEQAAQAAGVYQGSRLQALKATVRSVKPAEVERWIVVLADTDLALKRSRRSPDTILAEMLTRLCRPETRVSRRAS
jgi:DNA polymerase-3 subunit delta